MSRKFITDANFQGPKLSFAVYRQQSLKVLSDSDIIQELSSSIPIQNLPYSIQNLQHIGQSPNSL